MIQPFSEGILMLSRLFRLLPALVLLLGISAPAVAQTEKDAGPNSFKPVTVNGKAIPKSRLDFVVKQRTAQGTPDNDQLRKTTMDALITQEVVAQEAERKGMAKSAEVQTQLALARQQVLIQAYMQNYFKSRPITDEQMLVEYNKVKASRGDKEYKARHILVDKDTEAQEIIAQLQKGAKFEDLAKNSKDPGSKERGGDLDWNPPTTYVKPFAEALVKLEKGKYTETPVQSQFGWHVIMLEDVRPIQFPEFDAVKQQIRSMLQEQEVQKLIGELRSKAKIQ
jgi:peptidyl-prolyl cis-trans isomerase C